MSKTAPTPATMISRRHFLLAATALPCALRAEPAALPALRLSPDGWGAAPLADIRSVLESAMRELWRHFPGRKIEPIFVQRGHDGPIVHYKRNAVGEIVLTLDTQDLYWCQYVYQIAHEFCHILCGFDDDWKGNLWFEESLCETASLYVLRRLADTWAKQPPHAHWRDYAPRFAEYAQDVMRRRADVPDAEIAAYYQRHRAAFERDPTDRERNGTIALFLLRQLESAPSLWESVTWLNSAPSPRGETLAAYLAKWHTAAPDRCRAFISSIARRFAVELGKR
jgi:hypothetical protein